jgi:uncharacterized membrane protein YdbT with pleckstrin-like domain
MKKNMGLIDKVIRILVVIGLMAFYFTNTIVGTWAIIALVVSVIFLVTSLISFCPLYTLFGISTCKKK